MMEQLFDYSDQWHLIKPNKNPGSSGNGILYTSVAFLLEDPDKRWMASWYENLIQKCMLKPGLLTRVPDNSQKQESWDDYLGVAAACIKLSITSIPRQILWYALTHAFIMKTESPLTINAWLGRFPHMWCLMWIAAFPCLKWPLWPALWFAQCFFTFNFEDTSGWQLAWIFLEACDLIGFRFNKYNASMTGIWSAFKIYYSEDHPFIEAIRQKCVLELSKV